MIDSFGRTISYLRVSVTDRCNLRCRYCMPAQGVKLLAHRDILSFEEITQLVRVAVGMGITKVRLTGGEPLVRRGIVDLVQALAGIEGITDLAMTTNATLLADHAPALARAGLHRVNISLDTTDPDRYRRLTRGGDIQQVFAGINAALDAGLTPIKLNCVLGESITDADALAVRKFANRKGLQFRLIRLMNLRTGRFSVVQNGSGGDCRRCNRLRLSSNGQIRPCLFSDLSFSVRLLGPDEAIRQALAQKPQAGRTCTQAEMHSIGG